MFNLVSTLLESIFGMPDLFVLTVLALIGSVIGLLGGILFLYYQPWSKILEKYSVPFAAGSMITVATIALLPESVHMIGESAFVVMLISFFGAFFFEHFLFPNPNQSHDHSHDHFHDLPQKLNQSSTMLVVVGDTIHNFIDGVAIGASFVVNPFLGLTTAISTLLHELPHEIGDFGVLLNAGWQKKKVILVNLVSSLATVLGAFGVLLIAQNFQLIGILLAVSAGIFFYLGTIDFIPHSFHTNSSNKKTSFIALLLGVLVLFMALKAMPHQHDHEGHNHEDHSQEIHNHADSEDHSQEIHNHVDSEDHSQEIHSHVDSEYEGAKMFDLDHDHAQEHHHDHIE
jgi:zinc and cadmium transporter